MGWPEFPSDATRFLDRADDLKQRLKEAGQWPPKEAQMLKTLTVVPAYGKDYQSAKDATQAWKQGTDFQVEDIGSKHNQRYTSVRNAKTLQDEGIGFISIRFKSLSQVAVVQL